MDSDPDDDSYSSDPMDSPAMTFYRHRPFQRTMMLPSHGRMMTPGLRPYPNRMRSSPERMTRPSYSDRMTPSTERMRMMPPADDDSVDDEYEDEDEDHESKKRRTDEMTSFRVNESEEVNGMTSSRVHEDHDHLVHEDQEADDDRLVREGEEEADGFIPMAILMSPNETEEEEEEEGNVLPNIARVYEEEQEFAEERDELNSMEARLISPAAGGGGNNGNGPPPRDVCPICFDPFTSGGDHQLCCLPCGHLYGMSCIKKWLQSSLRCPQCKRPWTSNDITVLYATRLHVVDEEIRKTTALEQRVADLEQKVAAILERHQKVAAILDPDPHQERAS